MPQRPEALGKVAVQVRKTKSGRPHVHARLILAEVDRRPDESDVQFARGCSWFSNQRLVHGPLHYCSGSEGTPLFFKNAKMLGYSSSSFSLGNPCLPPGTVIISARAPVSTSALVSLTPCSYGTVGSASPRS